MTWTQIKKVNNGGRNDDPNWVLQPCAHITKCGVTLNHHCIETFGFTKNGLVCVFVDEKNGKIGSKIPSCEEDQLYAYKTSSSQSRLANSVTVSCKQLRTLLSEHAGKTITLHLNSGERIVEGSFR